MKRRIILAITGASGAQLGYAVMKALKQQDMEIHLILSRGARRVIALETEYTADDFTALADFCYEEEDLGACIASGSYITEGMIVVPCSMKTLSGIANAYDENLIIRAADVCLKEKRRLVLVPREAPLNNAHLRNMLTASQDGAAIIPPVLCFYANAETVQKQISQITGKILMQFGLTHPEYVSWEGNANGSIL